jgi:methylmalonyl-CoA mutase cobalamin-binding domain/chain
MSNIRVIIAKPGLDGHDRGAKVVLRDRDAADITVFGGGIIPDADIAELKEMGVARIFTPGATTSEIVDWVRSAFGTA